MEAELGTLLNGGGILVFSWVVYRQLAGIAEAIEHMAKAIAVMEERGHRIQRRTPPHLYERGRTAEGIGYDADMHTPIPPFRGETEDGE